MLRQTGTPHDELDDVLQSNWRDGAYFRFADFFAHFYNGQHLTDVQWSSKLAPIYNAPSSTCSTNQDPVERAWPTLKSRWALWTTKLLEKDTALALGDGKCFSVSLSRSDVILVYCDV